MGFQDIKTILKSDKQNSSYRHLKLVFYSSTLTHSTQLLPELLASLNVSLKPTLLTRFRQLLVTAWTKNGDSLSLFYSGTRALSFEGKKNKVRRVTYKVTSSGLKLLLYNYQ